MSPAWEKVFFVFSYITQGSSYMSARAYAIMHRMHHAYTDTANDPHSPSFDSNMFTMMWRTRNTYAGILNNRVAVEERFTKNLPEWGWFDRWGNNFFSRIIWVGVYITLYLLFAPSAWWLLLVPIHIAMGPVHGVIVNWFAHKHGHVNFETTNTSRNLFKVDVLMLGEGYHNNHHVHPSSSNFAAKKGEFDLCYPVIRLFDRLGVIRINRAAVV